MKFLLLLPLMFTLNLYAQEEDAAILNDEMSFLRESAMNTKPSLVEKKSIEIVRASNEETEEKIINIEDKYFSDRTTTIKAAPKRKRSFGSGAVLRD
jgi:hypothetical protein